MLKMLMGQTKRTIAPLAASFYTGLRMCRQLEIPPLHFRTTKPTSGGSCLLHMIIEIKIGRWLWNWIASMLKH
jgi:hypothetical protein